MTTDTLPTLDPQLELRAAFFAARKAIPQIERTATNSYHHSQYTPLEDLLTAIGPALEANGFTLNHRFCVSESQLAIEALLVHVNGGMISSGAYPLICDNPSNPQQLAGATTYARRVTTCTLLGIQPGGEDSDGEDATGHGAGNGNPSPRPAPAAPPSPLPPQNTAPVPPASPVAAAKPSPAPAAPPQGEDMASDKQRGLLYYTLKDANLIPADGTKDEQEAALKEWCSNQLGREIRSSREITKREMSGLIKAAKEGVPF